MYTPTQFKLQSPTPTPQSPSSDYNEDSPALTTYQTTKTHYPFLCLLLYAGLPYSAELIVLFFMLVVFFVLGVVGNALAFYIYYQKRDKTTSTLFILSLAATDFLTCLIGIPYTLATEMLK